jgi:hypothetical protein
MMFLPQMTEGGILPAELDGGIDDSPYARPMWKPTTFATDRRALVPVYEALGGCFPPLFENLVLSYRWLEVDLAGFVCLLANPPAADLTPLLRNITANRIAANVLLPLGFVQFGRQFGDGSDFVCFDTARRQPDGDCPVVQIEHESVLCGGRVVDSSQIADSFRALVNAVIAKARAARTG